MLRRVGIAEKSLPNLLKTRSALATQLVEEGLLCPAKVMLHGTMINGFKLSGQGCLALAMDRAFSNPT